LFFVAEKTSKKALAGITLEEQINAIHRSQGLLDDDNNRIGPSVPKPTSASTYSSTAKTIQKPPQLSPLVTKPMISMTGQPQRTLVATSMIQRGILPQATHTMVAMPSMMTVASQPIHPPPFLDEPASKRSKTEEQLMPEEDFYKTFGKVKLTFLILFD
jgi:hypothetical protein